MSLPLALFPFFSVCFFSWVSDKSQDIQGLSKIVGSGILWALGVSHVIVITDIKIIINIFKRLIMSIKLMIAQISISLLYFKISSKCVKEKIYFSKVIYEEKWYFIFNVKCWKKHNSFFFIISMLYRYQPQRIKKTQICCEDS